MPEPIYRYLGAPKPNTCTCGPPTDSITIHRSSGRVGEIAVCEHDTMWRLIDPGDGHMHLRWQEVRGWAAMRARRKLAHAPGYRGDPVNPGKALPPERDDG